MPSPVPRRWLRRGLVAAAVVLVALGVAAAVVLLHKPGNVSHPNLQFTRPSTTTPAAPKHTRRVVDNFSWPWYGFTPGRTRFFAAPANLRPPLRVGWRLNDRALLEFPPSIYRESLFLLDDNGSAAAVSLSSGRVQLRRQVGSLAAATPAVAAEAGEVLMPVLSMHGRSPGNGRFVALSIKTGRVLWSRPLGAGSESSAIVSGQTVYFGDQAGNLYARNVRNGHLYWTYHASGAIKGGPALVNGVLYFGDYAGRAYAVRAVDGRQVWAVGTDGAHFGFGSGQFYSTPAVAFGRVYLGNTDGRVYSFGARTGALAWATATGAYVYASPAVASPAGLGPTVYIGSYDGNFYAFNAQSGAVRWRHAAGGKISGSATVLGNVVYYSDLGTKTTAGLNAGTGRQVFSFPDGAFNPIIADYQAIYLVGYSRIYQLLPQQRRAAAHHALRARHPRKRGKPRRRPASPFHRRREPARNGHAPKAHARVTTPSSDGTPPREAPGQAPRDRPQVTDRRPAPPCRCYSTPSMRCRSGSHCQQAAEKGRRFCAEHAAELDRMREELKDAAAARIGRGRPKRSSTCCRPGCYEPRVPPAAYCDTCAAAGYVEEAA
ncbi:MAG: PQQ-binding-like beta-propeller repeat protein [Solirubrobacteraceae bacterium]